MAAGAMYWSAPSYLHIKDVDPISTKVSQWEYFLFRDIDTRIYVRTNGVCIAMHTGQDFSIIFQSGVHRSRSKTLKVHQVFGKK